MLQYKQELVPTLYKRAFPKCLGDSKGDYHSLVLSLSKGGSWFDKLTTNGIHGLYGSA